MNAQQGAVIAPIEPGIVDLPILDPVVEAFGDQAALFNEGVNPVTNELVPIPRLQDGKFFLATSIIPPARAGTVFKTSHS